MSNRLELIASSAKSGDGVADVGTDHAYIPIILRRSGYKGNIIAGLNDERYSEELIEFMKNIINQA